MGPLECSHSDGQKEISMKRISDYFGELTFGIAQMREKLPKESYQNLIRTLENGKKLSSETADAIASVVKEWAVQKGATHFCHWFQPMTGLTAEKHDSFISIQHAYYSETRVMERFSGSQLIQGEPDASSFPSGGMRTTFEARGYTAWDPSSPIFIIEGHRGHTLCIPTVFFGYHGEALDNKTPLLRSNQVLSKEACEFLKLLGDVDVKSVTATLGAEQEYFLIERHLAEQRPDLILTGRTLLGSPSTRGQQLEDHYFGAIPARVKAFMEDVEYESYRLGIPVKTRHNEVAPSQFELAPIFEGATIAADHNTLLMDTLKRVAFRHEMICLTHEKPFAGINGSGKHCNWSLCNDKGENLLEPGNTPHQNLRFLAIIAVVLKAVHAHAAVLRAAIASAGNDHRLGANEAPPAIISVFLGSLLEKILTNITQGVASQATEAEIIHLGVSHIPDISKDYTDRNRTSPFAFTGNKFEFRAVGASANVSVPVCFLNAAVAQALKSATQDLKALLAKKSGTRDEAVMELIRNYIEQSRAIRFEGNNYSQAWRDEAKKRGLPILSTTPEAVAVLHDKASTEFLVSTQVLSRPEIEARYHIAVERYNKTIQIEVLTLLDLARTYVVPALEAQLSETLSIQSHLTESKSQSFGAKRTQELQTLYGEILEDISALADKIQNSSKLSSEEAQMKSLSEEALPLMEKLRKDCDQTELLVADKHWPLPKYRELLFSQNLS